MILITGGTGFVGAHLLLKLVEGEIPIRAIYRQEKKIEVTRRIFAYYTKNIAGLFSKIEWVKGDLNDIPSLEEAFKDITHVYHCAALVSFEPNKFNHLKHTNIEGTANMVNLCLSYKIQKLCYVSSIAALGAAKNGEEITETTVWNPESENNVYSITKYGAELEVWRGVQEGVNAVIVNPGVILGPGIWRYGSGNIFKQIHRGLSYYPPGANGYISVNDVVNAMIALMKSNIVNERFILVSENRSYKSLIDEIAQNLKVTPPQKVASSRLLNMAWRLDWLKHKLTGKPRALSKNLAKTLVNKSVYSNVKLSAALDFKFTPIKTVIAATAKRFLEAHSGISK